ncbi:MAG: SAM-dependent methyltransferase, partial [Tepidiformaceae bacterium]
MEQMIGHVWIVGGGPGDPGLITVAGAKALSEAQVVVYDALSSPALLRGVPESAERV